MATTCDYCHKPLSLMRRLRGEQFCSVEHLDQYTAQQAEFALQRLAASVDDKPNTDRPPALLKRIARAPEEVPVAAPVARTVETVSQEGPSEEFLRVAGALAEPEEPRRPLVRRVEPPPPPAEPEPIAAAPEPEPIAVEPDPEYPLAAFVEQGPIQPRVVETTFTLEAREPELEPGTSILPDLAVTARDLGTWPSGDLRTAAEVEPVAPADVELSLEPTLAFTPEPRILDPVPALESHIELAGPVKIGEPQPQTPPDLAQPVVEHVQAEPAAPSIELAETPSVIETPFEPPQPSELRHLALTLRDSASVEAVAELADPTEPAPLAPALDALEVIRTWAQAAVLPAKSACLSWMPGAQAGEVRFTEVAGPTVPAFAHELPQMPEGPLRHLLPAPHVAMPESAPRTSIAATPSTADLNWMPATGAFEVPNGPATLPRFATSGPAFGWEIATPRTSPSTELASEANDAPALSPRIRDFRARVLTSLEPSEPRSNANWAKPRVDASMLDVESPSAWRHLPTVIDPSFEPLLASVPARLNASAEAVAERAPLTGDSAPVPEPSGYALPSGEPRPAIPLGPRPGLRLRDTASAAARSSEFNCAAPILQPVRYSPVAITVVPPPQFSLRPSAITEEPRFVAQAPKGLYRLPRLRHTGYRMPGPFPKMPPRLPDQYLRSARPKFTPADTDLLLDWDHLRPDDACLPSFEHPAPTRLHPADYFAWPKIKTPRTDRILSAREYDCILGPEVGDTHSLRRFGPTRAGLQGPARNADPQTRTGS